MVTSRKQKHFIIVLLVSAAANFVVVCCFESFKEVLQANSSRYYAIKGIQHIVEWGVAAIIAYFSHKKVSATEKNTSSESGSSKHINCTIPAFFGVPLGRCLFLLKMLFFN